MKTVKMYLKEKGNQIWSTTPNTPVFEALQIMADKDIGALVVLDNDKIAGIFSERDYARKVILKGKTSRNTPVREIMTTEMISIRPQQSVDECMAIMERRRIRYLPVVEGSKLIGMVSLEDVLQEVIYEQQAALSRLEVAGLNQDL